MAKNKIKTRKQREKEYKSKYLDVDNDIWMRLKNHLGDNLNEHLLLSAKDRIKESKKIKYHKLNFTFYEEPVQSHRPRVNFYTRNMHVPNAKENSDAIEKLIKDIRHDIELISTPMKVILTAYYPMPNNINDLDLLMYELQHDYAIGKPDFDNILKAYCDMIQTHIILDDDLVCCCEFNKFFSLKPRVLMSIIYPDGFSSEYTYKKIKSRKSFKDNEDIIKSELVVKKYKKKRVKK